MLRILGSAQRLCHGVTRRDMLRAGALGLSGLSLADFFRLREHAAQGAGTDRPPGFGRARSIILIHLYGAPSQLEWVDPKPDAPVEIRGELGAIESSLSGCQVGELFPHMARVMDKVTVLRSLTHPYPIHGVAYALTGASTIDVAMELSPHDPRHWPYFGSVVEFVQQQGQRTFPDVPANIALPFPFSSRRKGEVPRAGPYAAFLGSEFDPVWTDFVGTATRGHTKTLQDMVYNDHDPYMGVARDCHFVLPAASGFPAEVTLDRLLRRRSLLDQFNDARVNLDATLAGSALDRHQHAAMAILASDKLGLALDIRRESAEVRDLYGDTLFGQSCLAARRLVEAGSRVVSVFWDEFGLAGTGWDTHWNHYPRMRDELSPGFDRGWYGLITDLDRRGLLEETLVVCTSEHGRTPKMNAAKGGGRDHWSNVYSSVMAGGGVARGRIVGQSDRHAAEVADSPLSPKDLLATMYHLLGIDHRQIVHDRLGRPLPLVDGEIIGDAIA